MFRAQLNHCIRIVEKVPSVNLLHYLKFGNENVFLTPKCGSRTVRDAFVTQYQLESRGAAWEHVRYVSRRGLRKNGTRGSVVFVRDPFERVYSCWKQKIRNADPSSLFYFWQYYPRLRPNMAFTEFVSAISSIPVNRWEKHFIPHSFFFEPGMDVQYVRIDSLTDFLRTIAPRYDGRRANVTTDDSGRLDEERAVFWSVLGETFSGDQQLYNDSATA